LNLRVRSPRQEVLVSGRAAPEPEGGGQSRSDESFGARLVHSLSFAVEKRRNSGAGTLAIRLPRRPPRTLNLPSAVQSLKEQSKSMRAVPFLQQLKIF